MAVKTLNEHVLAVVQNRPDALNELQSCAALVPSLRQEIETELASLPSDVLERCWITRRRHKILSQALGS